MPTSLKLGTRGSQLALYQANTVASLLRSRAGLDCEIVVIKTSGDRLADAPLSEIGGKRLFVKEIEDALLDSRVDLAVHSSKDMPALLPEGLIVGAVLPREDARDAIVLPMGAPAGPPDDIAHHLGASPRIGTSSVRRTAQLRQVFQRARFEPIRGNLDTRLRKLDERQYDALVLAAAGLIRLGHAGRISAFLSHASCVPAPGQGIIAVEVRDEDERTRQIMETINDTAAAAALRAERAVVSRLGGGCQMPIGAYAAEQAGRLTLSAIVTSIDGSRVVRAQSEEVSSAAAALGERVADDLLARGAADILASVEQSRATVEGLQP
jgi:hydroxymethylbilane synthase